tara:strand:+ start:351 stop:953 length:603 start_codon:yes stop_codon:yes gene_type:complete
MLKVGPFDTYKTYLSLKNHFTSKTYDYHKYCGKSRASVQSFYKRKDRFWFEKLARQKDDKEIENFFIANFVSCSDPQTLWIGEIIRNGETSYTSWQKKVQSLSYIFKQESKSLFGEHKVDDVFDCSKGHPIILKKFLSGKISLETLVIYDRIFLFRNNFDKKMDDPVWETVSLKMKKYSPFLNIDVFRFKKLLKQVVIGE